MSSPAHNDARKAREESLSNLSAMFSGIEMPVLSEVLDYNKGNLEATIDQLLSMNEKQTSSPFSSKPPLPNSNNNNNNNNNNNHTISSPNKSSNHNITSGSIHTPPIKPLPSTPSCPIDEMTALCAPSMMPSSSPIPIPNVSFPSPSPTASPLVDDHHHHHDKKSLTESHESEDIILVKRSTEERRMDTLKNEILAEFEKLNVQQKAIEQQRTQLSSDLVSFRAREAALQQAADAAKHEESILIQTLREKERVLEHVNNNLQASVDHLSQQLSVALAERDASVREVADLRTKLRNMNRTILAKVYRAMADQLLKGVASMEAEFNVDNVTDADASSSSSSSSSPAVVSGEGSVGNNSNSIAQAYASMNDSLDEDAYKAAIGSASDIIKLFNIDKDDSVVSSPAPSGRVYDASLVPPLDSNSLLHVVEPLMPEADAPLPELADSMSFTNPPFSV